MLDHNFGADVGPMAATELKSAPLVFKIIEECHRDLARLSQKLEPITDRSERPENATAPKLVAPTELSIQLAELHARIRYISERITL